MKDENEILQQRSEAKYHVQVRLTNVPNDLHPKFFGNLRLRGRVIDIFRADDEQMQIGDFIEFDVHVLAEKAPPSDDSVSIEYSRLLRSHYLEMFVDFISRIEFDNIRCAVRTENVVLLDAPAPPVLAEAEEDEILTIPGETNGASSDFSDVLFDEIKEFPPLPDILADWKNELK